MNHISIGIVLMVNEEVKNVTKLTRTTFLGNSGNDKEDALKQ